MAISGFEVNITRGNIFLIQQEILADTFITYIRGIYNISVAGIIGDHMLVGKTSTIEMNDKEGNYMTVFMNLYNLIITITVTLDIFSNYSFNLDILRLNTIWRANCTININVSIIIMMYICLLEDDFCRLYRSV